MFEIFSKDEDKGQVGIGTLIVFIAMVLVAAIAAGVLINTAGFLQSQSEETGEQSSQQVTNRLDIVSKTGVKTTGSGIDPGSGTTYGTVDSGSDKLGTVSMIVTKAPGAQDIDLQDVTVQFVTDGGTFDLVSQQAAKDGSGNNDGYFAINPIKDADGSATVVNSPDDRMELFMTLSDSGAGAPDASSPSSEPTAEPSLLEEGDTVTLAIATEDSSSSTVRLTVPQSLSGQTAATL
jgi:flagellin-like protein